MMTKSYAGRRQDAKEESQVKIKLRPRMPGIILGLLIVSIAGFVNLHADSSTNAVTTATLGRVYIYSQISTNLPILRVCAKINSELSLEGACNSTAAVRGV